MIYSDKCLPVQRPNISHNPFRVISRNAFLLDRIEYVMWCAGLLVVALEKKIYGSSCGLCWLASCEAVKPSRSGDGSPGSAYTKRGAVMSGWDDSPSGKKLYPHNLASTVFMLLGKTLHLAHLGILQRDVCMCPSGRPLWKEPTRAKPSAAGGVEQSGINMRPEHGGLRQLCVGQEAGSSMCECVYYVRDRSRQGPPLPGWKSGPQQRSRTQRVILSDHQITLMHNTPPPILDDIILLLF